MILKARQLTDVNAHVDGKGMLHWVKGRPKKNSDPRFPPIVTNDPDYQAPPGAVRVGIRLFRVPDGRYWYKQTYYDMEEDKDLVKSASQQDVPAPTDPDVNRALFKLLVVWYEITLEGGGRMYYSTLHDEYYRKGYKGLLLPVPTPTGSKLDILDDAVLVKDPTALSSAPQWGDKIAVKDFAQAEDQLNAEDADMTRAQKRPTRKGKEPTVVKAPKGIGAPKAPTGPGKLSDPSRSKPSSRQPPGRAPVGRPPMMVRA